MGTSKLEMFNNCGTVDQKCRGCTEADPPKLYKCSLNLKKAARLSSWFLGEVSLGRYLWLCFCLCRYEFAKSCCDVYFAHWQMVAGSSGGRESQVTNRLLIAFVYLQHSAVQLTPAPPPSHIQWWKRYSNVLLNLKVY